MVGDGWWATPVEADDDLVGDVVDVLTSLCARLYGRRSPRNRALKSRGLRAA
jgi:putative resolvase